ncbi:hypothetical protein LI036_06645 [bacterium 210917-DFI.7.65]|nr:hypothetical protein [bacterium 210917-DFI.7.65]
MRIILRHKKNRRSNPAGFLTCAAIYAIQFSQPPDFRTYSAEVTGPGPQSPASSHLQRSRAYHPPVACLTIIQDLQKNVKQFFDLFYNLFSYFSVETPIFSSPRLLWLFYPKHCVSFPSVSVITPRLFGISKQPFAPPRPAAGTDRPSSAKICHSDRSEKPGVSKKGKKFFARCNKTPPPRVISMNSKHPLKIAEKQLDGG